jgi:hypothetical protein
MRIRSGTLLLRREALGTLAVILFGCDSGLRAVHISLPPTGISLCTPWTGHSKCHRAFRICSRVSSRLRRRNNSSASPRGHLSVTALLLATDAFNVLFHNCNGLDGCNSGQVLPACPEFKNFLCANSLCSDSWFSLRAGASIP